MTPYLAKLERLKSGYPFQGWLRMANTMPQHTQENCDAAQAILDRFLIDLAHLGLVASDEAKIALFREAVLALNELNMRVGGGLIETMEREDLAELFFNIATYAEIDCRQFERNDITLEWRTW